MLKCIISLKKFQTKLLRKNFKFTVIFILKKPLSFWLLLCPKKKKKKKAIIFLPSIHRSLIKWFDTWIYYSHIIKTRHDTHIRDKERKRGPVHIWMDKQACELDMCFLTSSSLFFYLHRSQLQISPFSFIKQIKQSFQF